MINFSELLAENRRGKRKIVLYVPSSNRFGYQDVIGLSHCLQCGKPLDKREKFFCSNLCKEVYAFL